LRIVIDTNLLVAALARPRGSSARILKLWREGRVEFVATEATLREAELVLGGGWLYRVASDGSVDDLLDELRRRSVIVDPAAVTDLNLRDSGDVDLVSAAVGGGAAYLVTADREVLAQRGYKDVEFLTSDELLQRHGGSADVEASGA
jgi:putative PIN family toxin of toxin-antitoxin system